MNLTDSQIFVKLIYDLWNNIDGYGEPETVNEIGYFRLSIQNERVGVCRHFSDDIVAKLNEINPKYNARNVLVYLQDKEYNMIDIDRISIDDEDHNDTHNDVHNSFMKKIYRKSCSDGS